MQMEFADCSKMRKEKTEVEFQSIYWDFRAFSSWTKLVRCTSEFKMTPEE